MIITEAPTTTPVFTTPGKEFISIALLFKFNYLNWVHNHNNTIENFKELKDNWLNFLEIENCSKWIPLNVGERLNYDIHT